MELMSTTRNWYKQNANPNDSRLMPSIQKAEDDFIDLDSLAKRKFDDHKIEYFLNEYQTKNSIGSSGKSYLELNKESSALSQFILGGITGLLSSKPYGNLINSGVKGYFKQKELDWHYNQDRLFQVKYINPKSTVKEKLDFYRKYTGGVKL